MSMTRGLKVVKTIITQNGRRTRKRNIRNGYRPTFGLFISSLLYSRGQTRQQQTGGHGRSGPVGHTQVGHTVRCYIGPAAANNSCHAVTLTDEYQSSLNAVDSSIFLFQAARPMKTQQAKRERQTNKHTNTLVLVINTITLYTSLFTENSVAIQKHSSASINTNKIQYKIQRSSPPQQLTLGTGVLTKYHK